LQAKPNFTTNTFAYHNISNRFNIGINNISPNQFEKHLKLFKNYKDVTICFDDAYEDIYINAYPLLMNQPFKKIIFPISEYIGKYNDWDVNFIINKKKHVNNKQLQDLNRSGWVIGSHGACHISYKTLNNNQIYDDLCKSKDTLEDLINKDVTIFTPPFGYFEEKFIDIALKVGYKKIYLNQCYLNKFQSIHTCALNRFNIYKHDTTRSIKRKINGNKIKYFIDKNIHLCSNATVVVKKFSWLYSLFKITLKYYFN